MTTPQPPQSGNPYAQQPQGGGFPPPAPQPSRGGRRLVLRLVISVVVLLVLIAGGALLRQLTKSEASSSNVGDCFRNEGTTTSPDMKKVGCGSAKAQYKVVSKHENTTDPTKCSSAGYAAYTETLNGKPTLLLCLKPVK